MVFVNSTIDKDELMPITAPLKPLEHCTGPFLNKCDMDNSGDIDLIEWGTCLGLEDGACYYSKRLVQ